MESNNAILQYVTPSTGAAQLIEVLRGNTVRLNKQQYSNLSQARTHEEHSIAVPPDSFFASPNFVVPRKFFSKQ